MSDTFFNKPPENPDKDTVYTMGGLGDLPADLGNFVGSAAQLAQLYPGSQNRPQYNPGLTDLRFTRSFQGASPGGSFYSPSGAGNAPGPTRDEIVYQQAMPDYSSVGGLESALMGGLLGMDWSGAYQDYLDKLAAQTQDVNISNVFTPTNTFTPTFNPSVDTNIDVSPTISNVNTFNPSNVNTVSPNINVSQTQTQAQTQQQQQSQGGGLDSFQDQTDTDFDTSDFSNSFMDYIRNLPRSTLQQILEQVVGTTSVSPSVSVYTSTVPTSITPYTSIVGVTTITDSFPIYDPNISDETVGGGLPDFFTQPDTQTGGTSTVTDTGTDTTTTDDQFIDFDLGRQDEGTVTDTTGTGTGTGTNIGTGTTTTDSGLTDLDSLVGGNVTDTLTSGNVNDTLTSDYNDTLFSGTKNDTRDVMDTVLGGNANDTLSGNYDDYLADDTVTAGNNVDTLTNTTDTTTETTSGGNNVDTVDGGLTNLVTDTGTGSTVTGTTTGGNAVDTLTSGLTDLDTLVGGNANDTLTTDTSGQVTTTLTGGTNTNTGTGTTGGITDTGTTTTVTGGNANDTVTNLDDELARQRQAAEDAYNRYGETLDLADLGNPNLTASDQFYLAGLAYSQNPTAATRENFYNWAKAMTPEATATPEQLADLKYLENQVIADRQPSAPLGARSQAEFNRFGETLDLNDLSNPNLSLTDRQYLAGLAYNQNPNPATRENYYNWLKAMTPEADATPVQLAELKKLEGEVQADRAGETLKNVSQDFKETLPPNLQSSREALPQFVNYVVQTAPELLETLANQGKDSPVFAGMGDLVGPEAQIVLGLLNGDSGSRIAGNIAATAATNLAVDLAANALAAAGIPGAGPAIAAVIMLDSILSSALGYDSPIQGVIGDFAGDVTKSLDRASSWVSSRAIGSDPLGAIGRGAGDVVNDVGRTVRRITRRFGFQEGGLVDLPGDSMYNDNQQGVLADIEGYARGGIIPLPGGGKIAKGPGGGLDDLIPTSIDGRRAAALSDGEFVIPADVVSMMGDGSTNAGSRRLYDLVRQVRQHKTGTTRQAGPLQVGKILERTMK